MQGQILAVDDDACISRLIKTYLNRRGYEVLAYSDPEQALATLRCDPEIRLIITDVIMPKLDGCELALWANSLQPQVPILFISGQDQGGLQAFEAKSGRVNFLAKPFSGDELCTAVDRLLGIAGQDTCST
jgi:DNA-binding NtrC family response regulator